MEPEGSLPQSQVPATCPSPSKYQSRFEAYLQCFATYVFYGEELPPPRPTPKLEDHPMSAVRDCLFNIFAATLNFARVWGSVVVKTLRYNSEGHGIDSRCRRGFFRGI
jgi:hypothetical protein